MADLLSEALQTRPAKQTHWSVRGFAAEASISKDLAHRLFFAASIATHRSRSFKLANNLVLVEKVATNTGCNQHLLAVLFKRTARVPVGSSGCCRRTRARSWAQH